MASAKVKNRREFTREFKVAAVKLVTEQWSSPRIVDSREAV